MKYLAYCFKRWKEFDYVILRHNKGTAQWTQESLFVFLRPHRLQQIIRPAIPVRVLAPKQKSTFKYVGTFIKCISAPLHTQFVARGAQVGRVEIPARKWFLKAPPRYHQLTRGVYSNIGDIQVKVRGSGAKVRFWTLFWQGNYEKPRLRAGCVDCKADFCDDQCIIKALKHDDCMAEVRWSIF